MCKSSIYIHILGSLSASRVGGVKKQSKKAKPFETPTRIKKPAPCITGRVPLFTWEIVYFLTSFNLPFLKLSFKSFWCRSFLFCSALCSRYKNHAPLIKQPPINILSSNGIEHLPVEYLRCLFLFSRPALRLFLFFSFHKCTVPKFH